MNNLPSIEANKLAQLSSLEGEVLKCAKCPLYKDRIKHVFERGNVDAKIMFVGEAPGENESIQGVPFCGRAGKLLDNMIRSINLNPERDVYICNVLKDRPPNNRKPLPHETEACLPFLQKQIEIIMPKIIVILGSTAMEALLGPGVGITKRRGKWEEYNGIRARIVFHPSYLLRNPSAKKEAWEDLQEIKQYLETC